MNKELQFCLQNKILTTSNVTDPSTLNRIAINIQNMLLIYNFYINIEILYTFFTVAQTCF